MTTQNASGVLGAPQLVFIAGGNGSGKSSLWRLVKNAPEYKGLPYLNADDYHKELLSRNPSATFRDASNWRNEKLVEFIDTKRSFVAETLLDPGKFGYLKRAQKMGFETAIHFIGLESADLAVSRVQERVAIGGHDIPEEVVRRKWKEALDSLDKAIGRVKKISIYDNSEQDEMRLVASIVDLSISFEANPPKWLEEVPKINKELSLLSVSHGVTGRTP